MQPQNGLIDVLVAILALAIGIEVAKLVAPIVAAVSGWGFGVVGALYIRKVAHAAIPYAFFTLGVVVAVSMPVAVWLSAHIGQSANALIMGVAIGVPFFGDKMIEWALALVPERFRALFKPSPEGGDNA